jgi:uncharacterized protein
VSRASSAFRPALVLVGLLVAAAAVTVAAQEAVPRNDGWVTDLAGFLTPEQERALETLMESYKSGSGNEIALLTVPDLGGRSLERYALEVARDWRIGEKDSNNGALLLVARKERKIRIEVGRGLEGTLTDSISGRIIRDVIAPRFKDGRYYEGLRAGVEAMQAAAGGDYAALPAPRGRGSGRPLAGLFPLIFLIILLISIIRRGGGGGRGGSIWPWLFIGSALSRGSRSAGWRSGGFGGGGFGGFGGGGGFSGGGASGGW